MFEVNYWYNPIFKQYELALDQTCLDLVKDFNCWILLHCSKKSILACWSNSQYTLIGLDLTRIETYQEGTISFTFLPYFKHQMLKMLTENPDYRILYQNDLKED